MKKYNLFTSIKPEILFVILIIISGSFSIFFVPVGGGFDEDTHIARIWEMSTGTLIPNRRLEKNGIPSIFYGLSYRQKFIIEPVEKNYIINNIDEKIDWDVMIGHQTRSIYFPTIYLVQAFIMGVLARINDAPLLLIYFFIRLSYLLIYAVITFLAIKLIPYGKWILTLLALSPMAIMQASIISPDAITHSVSFLFLAWILKLAREGKEPLNAKESIITLILIGVLFTVKINSSALILLFLLIPYSRFGSKRKYIFIILGIIVLFIVIAVGWSFLTSSQLTTSGNDAGLVLQQAQHILQHPGEYIQVLFRDIATKFDQYYKGWVGVFGYGYWNMPTPVYILFFVLLGISIAGEPAEKTIGVRERIILIATFIAGYVLTITLLFLKDNPVGAQSVMGVQGRYFIPIMPSFLLAFCSKRYFSLKRFKSIFFPGIILMMAIFSAGLYLSYHVNCGSKFYTSGYCYQPYYKNWDVNPPFSEEITTLTPLEQDFFVKCDDMEELRVWMGGPAQPGATTTLILSNVQSGKIILDISVNNESVPSNGWMTINFPVESSSQNQQYKFLVVSSDADETNGVVVGVSPRDEYIDGQLLINGSPVPFDILFQYGCNTSLLGD